MPPSCSNVIKSFYMNTQALTQRFRVLAARTGPDFYFTDEMQCITVLIYMLSRDSAPNKRRYEGLSDEEIVNLVVSDLETENAKFKEISKNSQDEYLKLSAQENLKLNQRCRGLVRRYLHN